MRFQMADMGSILTIIYIITILPILILHKVLGKPTLEQQLKVCV